MSEYDDNPDIAVIGLAGRFPGAGGIDGFWRNLRDGVESVTFFTPEQLRAGGVSEEQFTDPAYVPAGAVLDDPERFDAHFFGYSATEAALLDPQHRLFLETSWQALEDAGYPPERATGPVGVYAGASLSAYLLTHLLPTRALDASADGLAMLTANDKDYLASRTSYKLGLDGPALSVQTACSTSLVATHLACQALLNQDCDLALAGGATVRLPQTAGYRYTEGMIFSPDGHCRPFDAAARGTVAGSGVGVVVLKRLADAVADGDRIYAVIAGSAVNNDGGAKVGYIAPSVTGQARVIAAALGSAGVTPADISAIEAHGTGTALGDPIEVRALARVFANHAPPGGCALGSVKANIGHLDSAAGVASLIKAVLQLHHGELVPSINFTEPNPEIDFGATPFYVNTGLQSWKPNGRLRRIGVSSFGFGGTNAHLVLTEAPTAEPTPNRRTYHVLPVSAATRQALRNQSEALARALTDPDATEPRELADVAYTLQTGRRAFPHRKLVVADTTGQAATSLAEPDTGAGAHPAVDNPSIALLFPGQGSQYPGMGHQLYQREPVFAAEVDRCAELLTPLLGFDLRQLLFAPVGDEAAAARLADTQVAQPALFTIEYATARLLAAWGVHPTAMVGHSVGEFVAACLAGVFPLEAALRLVALRGRLVAEQPGGSMLSVALPEQQLRQQLPDDLDLAAVNAPEVCVVAGPAPAVARFAEQLTADGVPARPLHTSHAFHSRMMDPVVQRFAVEVAAVPLAVPSVRYVSTRTGDWITPEQATDPGYWAAHLREPVRFHDAVRRLLAEPHPVLLETGPGSTLATLTRGEPAARQAVVVHTLPTAGQSADGQEADRHLLDALGRVWLAGVDVDWPAHYAGQRRRRLSLPPYQFDRRRYWVPRPDGASTSTGALPMPAVVEEEIDSSADGATGTRPPLPTPYAPPRTPVEEKIAEIWSELLGVHPVGVADSFLELGGHSLLATKVVSRIAAELGVEVPLRRLVDAATVAAVAELVTELGGGVDTGGEQLPQAVPDWDNLHEPFPLSEIQQAQWLGRLSNFTLGNIAAHMFWELERPELDLQRLNLAWQKVMDRHPMLRVVFTGDGTQRILPEVPTYEIQVTDLRQADPEQTESYLAELRERLSHEVRPIDQWPLFEIRTVRLPHAWRIYLSFDLLMADMGSVRILLRDWRLFYQDPDRQLPAPRISFRDYRIAAEQVRQTPMYQRSLEYWRERVKDLPAGPELPIATPPEQITQPRFVPYDRTIPTELWQRVKQQAARHGVTPSAALLAAYAQVIGAWSSTSRFTLNVTTNIRLPVHPDAEDLVGGFASFALQEIDLRQPVGIAELARRMQQQNWQDLEHRYVNGVEILRELTRYQGGTTGSAAPIVFTSTLIDDGDADRESMVDWLGTPVYEIVQTPQVWLDVAVLELAGGLGVCWAAVDGLFPPEVVDQMFASFCDLLTALAEPDGLWTAGAALLPAGHSEVTARVNDTAAEVPDGLLCDPLLAAARRWPDQPAVIDATHRLTFGELVERACGLAHRLRTAGVGPNQLVAVALPKGAAQVVAVLGVLLAGGAYLPVDTGLPRARQQLLVERGRARMVVVPPGTSTGDWPEQLRLVELDPTDPGLTAAAPPEQVTTPTDLAYVIFTSGSTGEPKGVMISHRAALNTCLDVNQRFGVGPDDRVLGLSALNFDLSVWDIFGVLGAGGTLVLPGDDADRNPQVWYETMTAHRVTVWNTVPALMQMLTDHCHGIGSPLPDLRLALLSGDWIPLSLPERHPQLASPDLQVVSLGGATEAAIWSIAYPIGAVDPAWESIPYGHPLTNQRFEVWNDRWQPCPPWVVGELVIGGEGLADGYWDDPEKTAAAFVTHPDTGQRWYRTGDLGRWWPDGTIEFLGRRDHQVKVGGYRIELGEIEAVLSGHPLVRTAVVTTAGDRHHQRLVGYVVPESETTEPDQLLEQVRRYAEGLLPHYMVPPVLQVLDRIPLTANGKVDRSALPDPEADLAPVTDPAELGPLARWLAELSAEVMGVAQVNPYGNFFQIGGDSITGVQIITRAREAGVDLGLPDLFAAQSIVELAELLEQRGVSGPAANSGEGSPLTAYQRSLVIGDRPADAVHLLELPLPGEVTAEQVGQVLRTVVDHNPALRLRFTAGEDGWLQQVTGSDPEAGYVPLIELHLLPAEQRAAALQQMLTELRQEIDPCTGAPYAVALFDLGGGDRRLVWLIHELVADPASWELLLAELLTGLDPTTPAVTLAPGDPFTRWLQVQPGTSGDQPAAAEPVATLGAAELDPSTTERLLSAGWQAGRLELADLAAAAVQVAAPLAQVVLLVDQRHRAEGLDLARTVGQFTGVLPVNGPVSDLDELLAEVRQQRRDGCPAGPAPADTRIAVQVLDGFGTGNGVADLLPAHTLRPWPVWAGAQLPTGRIRVSVVHTGGRIWIDCAGAAAEPVAEFAAGVADALRRLADHCAAGPRARLSAGEFPLAPLADKDLRAVLDDLTDEEW